MKPEWIPLGVNIAMLAIYASKHAEPGKILYWIGATILTCGLLLMKG